MKGANFFRASEIGWTELIRAMTSLEMVRVSIALSGSEVKVAASWGLIERRIGECRSFCIMVC